MKTKTTVRSDSAIRRMAEAHAWRETQFSTASRRLSPIQLFRFKSSARDPAKMRSWEFVFYTAYRVGDILSPCTDGFTGIVTCPSVYRSRWLYRGAREQAPTLHVRVWPDKVISISAVDAVSVAVKYPWCSSSHIEQRDPDDADPIIHKAVGYRQRIDKTSHRLYRSQHISRQGEFNVRRDAYRTVYDNHKPVLQDTLNSRHINVIDKTMDQIVARFKRLEDERLR